MSSDIVDVVLDDDVLDDDDDDVDDDPVSVRARICRNNKD